MDYNQQARRGSVTKPRPQQPNQKRIHHPQPSPLERRTHQQVQHYPQHEHYRVQPPQQQQQQQQQQNRYQHQERPRRYSVSSSHGPASKNRNNSPPLVNNRTVNRTRPARQSMSDPRTSRAASNLDDFRPLPAVFDLFFDIPHPAASKDSERARMIEPPEQVHAALLAEMYEATAISRLARFAFPEHNDHRHATQVQQRYSKSTPDYINSNRRTNNRINGSRFDGSKTGVARNDLNELDVYLLGFRSDRIVFSIVLADGQTRLYGHVLRYLPLHLYAKTRADVGRRGARAMIILTRATGGDRFYTAVLRAVESVVVQGDAMSAAGSFSDGGRERAMRLLHGIHRRHSKKISEATMRVRRSMETPSTDELDDLFLSIPAIEFDVKTGPYIKERALPGDFIKIQLPNSLQAGFVVGMIPDDIDAPILPLLRSLGAENMIRLLSAMLCECRIILVSAHTCLLSACVRGASAMLAQGNLIWQHTLIPVLPPHLLNRLQTNKDPFLVGILEREMDFVLKRMNLKEVICIHLDKNAIRTLSMTKPLETIPDILSRDSAKAGTDTLLNDMKEILRTEARVWGSTSDKAGGGTTLAAEEKAVNAIPEEIKPAKKSKGKEKIVEKDIAHLFGKVMRGDDLAVDDASHSASSSQLESSDHIRLEWNSGHLPKSIDSTLGASRDFGTFDLCENERGEEGIRAALASFFLMTHGDVGTLLSEHRDGTFLLDRKKFLLSKKKAKTGLSEGSPMFMMYRKFSGTVMLETYLTLRIQEFERGRSNVMPRHRSLFSLCERHLRTKKIDFSHANIRQIIATTAQHNPFLHRVEKTELSRARALALTSAQPYEGKVAQALSSLMQECHFSDSSLPHTMAVIWSRLDDRRQNGWKHPLLGLHLLKNLLLHGPIVVISYVLDGADKIRKLRFYSNSKNENNDEVRRSAAFVWTIMTDRPRLLQRRSQVAAGRAGLLTTDDTPSRWSNYLLKKVPVQTSFTDYHNLVRPPKHSIPPENGVPPGRRSSLTGSQSMNTIAQQRRVSMKGQNQRQRVRGASRGNGDSFPHLSSHSDAQTNTSSISNSTGQNNRMNGVSSRRSSSVAAPQRHGGEALKARPDQRRQTSLPRRTSITSSTRDSSPQRPASTSAPPLSQPRGGGGYPEVPSNQLRYSAR